MRREYYKLLYTHKSGNLDKVKKLSKTEMITFGKTDDSTLTHHITQSLELALRFSLGVVHSVGLDKCITR